ncbi:mask [Symbiodinium sp. CCMP2592]|nr:mask [Symbiodinium sp. CCMP2592]
MLIHARADVELPDKDTGMTPLFWTTHREAHVQCARLLLEASADVKSVSKTLGLTPLASAACWGHVDMARLFVQAMQGTGTSMTGTAIFAAANKGHVEIVRLLLELQTDKDSSIQLALLALFCASCHNRVEVVRLILGLLDEEALEQIFCERAFFVSETGHVEILHLLLETKTTVHVGAREAALLNACLHDQLEVLQSLLPGPGRPSLANHVVLAGQICASGRGSVEIVRTLWSSLEEQEAVWTVSPRAAVLIYAAHQNHILVMEWLRSTVFQLVNYGFGEFFEFVGDARA